VFKSYFDEEYLEHYEGETGETITERPSAEALAELVRELANGGYQHLNELLANVPTTLREVIASYNLPFQG
jgi:hypothetical protein